MRLFRFAPRHAALALLLAMLPCTPHAQQPATTGWPAYGADGAGTRFSSAAEIKPANVAQLHPAWTFHTHALDDAHRRGYGDASFEATPILLGQTLYLTTPFDEVFALDATTGRELWHFDPAVKVPAEGALVTSRGVALWPADASSPDVEHPCATRILLGTLDARLLALDAATGRVCESFGNHGAVDLRPSVHLHRSSGYGLTSPPAVVGDVIVVGSSVADNQQVDIESGLVRAFDARTGRPLWSWEPLPWAAAQSPRTGAGNAWSALSVDPALGLVYVPTGSASPDFYGGLRPGDNRDADSVVALEARTGRRIWAFQTVHHNLWDYDVAAQPLLFTFRGQTPAIAIITKTAQVFVLDRRTGQPLYPIAERPVPQDGAPGERLSPTQPFSSLPSLAPLTPARENSAGWQRSPQAAASCAAQLQALRYDGIYTPPTTQGTLLYPGSLGGVNWGSAAFDPATGVLYANANRFPFAIQLLDRYSRPVLWRYDIMPVVFDYPLWESAAVLVLLIACIRRRTWRMGWRALVAALCLGALGGLVLCIPQPYDVPHFGAETSPQHGTPYLIRRQPVRDPDGNPCVAPPWSTLSALNLNTGALVFESPLGVNARQQPVGTLSLGGPIVTASGLVFDAATLDDRFRAFNASTGAEVWSTALPAPATATPMTYMLDGRQFVVLAVGGHAQLGSTRADQVIAFALEQPAR